MNDRSALIITEGPDDAKLLKKILCSHGLMDIHEIYIYRTNIYVLYDTIMRDYGGIENVDVKFVLSENESNLNEKEKLRKDYNETIFIFDADPQHCDDSKEKMGDMYKEFNSLEDNLYFFVNYPMVEAAYHYKSFPSDKEFLERKVYRDELEKHLYKERVDREAKNIGFHLDYAQKGVLEQSLRNNLTKLKYLITGEVVYRLSKSEFYGINQSEFLDWQFELYEKENYMYVLASGLFYFLQFNDFDVFSG